MESVRALLLALALVPAVASPAADSRAQGEAALRAGRAEEAAGHLERAVARAPNDAEAHYLLAQSYGAQAGAGGMITKMRLAGKVRDHFERAAALAPEEVRYREALLEFYVQAPSAMGGGADKARAQAAEIAKRDRARGLLAAGRIAQHEGDAGAALANYRQAAAERPEDARIALRLVIYLQEQKRWPEAFERLDALLARDPAAGAAWYQLGRTAVLANTRHADGERAFRRFLSLPRAEGDPPPEAAHWRLGMLYEQMGRKAEAKAEYQRALQANPEHKESKAALRKLG
ncbi:MAG: tetratricopeptide repeat protein [Steroidobacteraceae bacterium]|nr:tetratricopeptide repeat protein [Steroidobacteraceae bacterium]